MCLYTGDNKPQIAKKDIVCYKSVRQGVGFWFGPFFGHDQPYNKLLTAKRTTGFNEYEDIKCLTILEGGRIYEGYHSHSEYKEKYYENYHIALTTKICVIPKGAEYCKGFTDELVSTHIIVFENKKEYKKYRLLRPFIRLHNKLKGTTPKVVREEEDE